MNPHSVNHPHPRERSDSIPPADESLWLRRRPLRFLIPAFVLIGGAGLVWLGVDIGQIRRWLESIGPWAPLAFVLISIVLMSFLLPKTAVSLMAGALFGFALGSVLMVLIAVSAAALNYAIGRWWLHDSILETLRRKDQQSDDLHPTWIHAVRDLAADAGFGFHLLIRLSPVPTMVISYSMGAVGSRVRPYLLAAAVAIVPQSLWVYSGSAAATMSDPAASPLRWVSAIVSLLVAIWISIIVPREAMKRLRASDSAHQRPSPASNP
jgi:uncharacterized membrane protein YdjX (TVP38/TMEM64 family)